MKQLAAMIFAFAFALSSISVSAANRTIMIRVEGMHCGGCASSVEKKLKTTEGVEEVRVSFEKKEAWVKYDDQRTSVAKLIEVINSTGYKAVADKAAKTD